MGVLAKYSVFLIHCSLLCSFLSPVQDVLSVQVKGKWRSAGHRFAHLQNVFVSGNHRL